MVSHEFRAFVRRDPFRPYRVTLTDGRTYDVTHPDFGVVGLDVVVIGVMQEDSGQKKPYREVLISLTHVMQIEFLDELESGQGLEP